MSSIEMIRAAGRRLDGHVRKTPLLSSPFLDEIAGRKVLVKPECLQHSGSFKFRGGWSALSGISEAERQRGVLAYSSGNHAQGVALAARLHNVDAVIVMPSDAPQTKIANTRALGAEVVLYDRATGDREAIGSEISTARGLMLIRPFDEPLVIAGQGTTGLEIAVQAKACGITTASVLVPCGGGGLTGGIALALEEDAPGLKVHPSEPQDFDDVARSLASGKIEVNAAKTGSLCDAIVTSSPGQITFPILNRLCGPGLVVSEDDCLHAMALAWSHLKIVVEPGAAVGLAAALFDREADLHDTVIAVATGGNVDADVFQLALSRFGSTS